MNIRAACVLVFLLPQFNLIVSICVVFFEALNLFLFIIISFKDPSYETIKNSIPELYATVKPDFICPYCSVKKIHTTVHCHHCSRCVRVSFNQKYDHHCPWINNCVGEGNHKTFVFYLLVLFLNLTATISLCILTYLKIYQSPNPYLKHPPFSYPPYLPLFISLPCILAVFLILPLLCIQIRNLMSKKNSHDKYSYKQKGVLSSISSTSSILLKDSEDWSYFSKKSEKFEQDEDKGCCSSKSLPNLNQTSTINEENDT